MANGICFYHSMDISSDQHLRSVCVDKISFDKDGKIPEIKATKRGIGKVYAKDKIQIDRYSTLENGSVARSGHKFVNWIVKGISAKTVLTFKGIEYDKIPYTSVLAYVSSVTSGGQMMIYDGNEKLMATFDLPRMRSGEWRAVQADLAFSPGGMQDLKVKFKGTVDGLKLDWIKFIPENSSAIVASYDVQLDYNGKRVMTNGNNCMVYTLKEFEAKKLSVMNTSDLANLKMYRNGEPVTTLNTASKGGLINVVSLQKEVFYNPFERMLASNCSDQNGVLFEKCSLGGQNAAYIENGDNLIFDNLRFPTKPSAIELTVACQSNGGTIEVRKNGVNGTLLATLKVVPTGGFQSWKNISASLSDTFTEKDKLYLVFKGGNGFLFNVHSFLLK